MPLENNGNGRADPVTINATVISMSEHKRNSFCDTPDISPLVAFLLFRRNSNPPSDPHCIILVSDLPSEFFFQNLPEPASRAAFYTFSLNTNVLCDSSQ
jgi:hypothetical protein